MYGPKGGLEAAVAAATKLDASLHAKGKLAKNLSEGLSKSDVLKLIQAEFSINHVPQSTRNLLCKGSTQEIIKDFSGACVSTKGRYIPESERINLNAQDKSVKNLGLYLFIQGPTNRSVDLAIQKIEEMIAMNADMNSQRQNGASLSNSGPMHGSRPLVGTNIQQSSLINRIVPQQTLSNIEQVSGKFIEKIRIGMDNVLPGFNLPMKLIGQGASNLNYIKNETGAIVTLRGIGSAFIEPGTQQEAPEPLHFCIVHHKPEAMATARDLALNLIATVQQEYAQFQMQQPPPQNISAPIQTISLEPSPNIMLHQSGNAEHQIMPNVISTSTALPVVQTGFLQQPTVTQLTAPPPIVGVPPPSFSQPPPAQVALPPPGVHIPQQQNSLVPSMAPHLQIQTQPEQSGNFIQQIAQPFQAGQQTGQQQYVITQNGQPMQGLMTSQGLVVLNHQTQPAYAQQQVFLSQPPPVGPSQPVFQPGQPLAFQSPAANQQLQAAVSAPVSYQFQYVQQNPPPPMTYSAVQNPIQVQPSHIQIQPQQQAQMAPTAAPSVSSAHSPVQNQQPAQSNPNVSLPPPSISHQSSSIQNPPNPRHSPIVQAPPPNHHNPSFSVQSNQNPMLVQQISNPQIIQNNQAIPVHNQNIQTIPVTAGNLLPGQPQLMQIQGVRSANEVQPQFQFPQQNYSQRYQQPPQQQQVVMKQIQVCQPQQLQFVSGCPPGPIQILPAPTSGQFIPPVHQLPPHQSTYPQGQEPQQQEPKPAKRKFTEEGAPTSQQGSTPPQSLMSIPMQPPQPVPPPTQTVASSNSNRQGIGVQELMLMNQQQRRQHMQQPEGLQKDPSMKVEEASVVPLPPPSTGNQQNFPMGDPMVQDGDKGGNQQPRQWYDDTQLTRDMATRDGRHECERERGDRNCGFTRRDRNRERPIFSHYSSKPQMYDTMVQHPILRIGICPPPPPPPPPLLINQPQNPGQQQQPPQQQHSPQQQQQQPPQPPSQQQHPPNHYYQTNRSY